jgi:hypothetical protein
MNDKNNIEEDFVYYPVIIPTLNRYDHFKKCVESLRANTHADKTELVIGIDYPPSEKYVEGWKKICDYAKQIDGFRKVTIFYREENLGPRGNVEKLREYAYDNYDALISTEDDNVFSPNFLDFINKGLYIYKNDKNILSICGYMSPIEFDSINKSKSTVVLLQEYETWGYGRWKDREEELNNHMPYKYMEYVCKHRKLLKKLHKYPRNLYQLIFWPLFNPKLNGKCDFALSCYCKLNGKYTVNPICSLVRNEGNDGSGFNNARIIDERSVQKIPDDNFFEIVNNFQDNELNQIMEIVYKWKNKDCMEVPVNRPWRLLTELFYFSYMTIGFDVSMVFYKFARKIYRFCKKMKIKNT